MECKFWCIGGVKFMVSEIRVRIEKEKEERKRKRKVRR